MRDGPLFVLLMAALIAFCCGRESDATPSLEARVRAVLEQMPRSVFDDETPVETGARLDEAAHVIALASRDEREAAALLVIGEFESRFAQYVRDGCHYPDGIPRGAGHCDRGQSRSYWQMKVAACRSGWAHRRGSEAALREFAVCARKRFLGALKRCRGLHPGGDVAGAMAGFRSVDCTWEGRRSDGARARDAAYWRRLSQLR